MKRPDRQKRDLITIYMITFDYSPISGHIVKQPTGQSHSCNLNLGCMTKVRKLVFYPSLNDKITRLDS